MCRRAVAGLCGERKPARAKPSCAFRYMRSSRLLVHLLCSGTAPPSLAVREVWLGSAARTLRAILEAAPACSPSLSASMQALRWPVGGPHRGHSLPPPHGPPARSLASAGHAVAQAGCRRQASVVAASRGAPARAASKDAASPSSTATTAKRAQRKQQRKDQSEPVVGEDLLRVAHVEGRHLPILVKNDISSVSDLAFRYKTEGADELKRSLEVNVPYSTACCTCRATAGLTAGRALCERRTSFPIKA